MNKVFFLIIWFIYHKNVIYACCFRHFSTIFWERNNSKDEIIEETTPNIITTNEIYLKSDLNIQTHNSRVTHKYMLKWLKC
jgi:hypothetical protein